MNIISQTTTLIFGETISDEAYVYSLQYDSLGDLISLTCSVQGVTNPQYTLFYNGSDAETTISGYVDNFDLNTISGIVQDVFDAVKVDPDTFDPTTYTPPV